MYCVVIESFWKFNMEYDFRDKGKRRENFILHYFVVVFF